MNKIEELYLLEELLRRHNLPFSPVLEYAIKERIKEYSLSTNCEPLAKRQEISCTDNADIDDYGNMFKNLSVGIANGRKLPHKALLLLAVLNLIENGSLIVNQIELDKTIASKFADQWNIYYENTKCPSVWTPFWYMKSEPFWHFKSNGDNTLLNGLLNFAGHPTIGQMRSVIKYAYLDKALFDYLENEGCRKKLKDVLVNTYISNFD